MLIAVSRLRGLVERALQHYGYTDDEVPLLADVILYAQLRDNNQGIVKLIPPGFSRGTPVGEVQTVRDTKVSALLDGNQNPGMVVMMRAVDLAIAKANGIGIAIVGTFNTGSSTGAIGYYARRLAYAGFIVFVFA
ncbi:MAG: Ldh family oxidoreductase [Aeromicrobium sp.]